ncbi:MAG TPA: hypothetical protein PKV41_01040, partial [Candidatus Omnitrophota bacterium]|nr:hypothetical protein [Candidatus Omnitrophota bacterium]
CMNIWVGTKKGAFFLKNGKWMPVYKGMETNEIAYLTDDASGTVYAATAKGIFYLPVQKALPSFYALKDLDMFAFDDEPNIRAVHQWAIDYAEVSHKKIEDWRRRAQASAWLPDLDMGVDGGRDASVSDSIWGSYSNGGQFYIGPDDRTSGRDFGWDVSLSWDFSEVLWSSDQTAIDSRSKMMVELRDSILNEVTRLYFERRRIQMELAALRDQWDPPLRIDREMRIAELTALIDALTGGKFSENIKKNSERNSLIVADATEKEGMR